jgi:hypothetical protein
VLETTAKSDTSATEDKSLNRQPATQIHLGASQTKAFFSSCVLLVRYTQITPYNSDVSYVSAILLDPFGDRLLLVLNNAHRCIVVV